MKTEYSKGIPQALARTIKARLAEVEGYWPSWVNKLSVEYSPDPDGDGIASCVPKYEYRSFALTIHPLFFDDEDWRGSLLHEMGHGLFKPYTLEIEKLVEHYVPPEARAYVNSRLRDAEEAVSEDIAIWAAKLRSKEGEQP